MKHAPRKGENEAGFMISEILEEIFSMKYTLTMAHIWAQRQILHITLSLVSPYKMELSSVEHVQLQTIKNSIGSLFMETNFQLYWILTIYYYNIFKQSYWKIKQLILLYITS